MITFLKYNCVIRKKNLEVGLSGLIVCNYNSFLRRHRKMQNYFIGCFLFNILSEKGIINS